MFNSRGTYMTDLNKLIEAANNASDEASNYGDDDVTLTTTSYDSDNSFSSYGSTKRKATDELQESRTTKSRKNLGQLPSTSDTVSMKSKTFNMEELILKHNNLLKSFDDLSKKYNYLEKRLLNTKNKQKTKMNAQKTNSSIPNPLNKNNNPNSENTNNRFDILQPADEEVTDSKTEKEAVETVKKPPAPPPVVVYNLELKGFSAKLQNKLNHNNYSFKRINKNITHVLLKHLPDYKTTIALLKESNQNFFTYTPKEEKPTNLIIKNLDPSFDEEDIKTALTALNLKDLEIVKIFKLNIKIPNKAIWLLQINKIDLKEILNVKYLLNQRIRITKFKNSGIIQCKNCQRFGHIASKCDMPYRCVKCKNTHEPGECSKPKKGKDATNRIEAAILNNDGTLSQKLDDIPECINCGKPGHPANYKKCEKYIEIKQRREQKLQEKLYNQRAKLNYVNNYIKETKSFSSLFRNDTPPIPPTNNPPKNKTPKSSNFNFLNNDCSMLFGMDLFEVLRKVDDFLPNYRSLTEINQKRLALISLVTELTVNSRV